MEDHPYIVDSWLRSSSWTKIAHDAGPRYPTDLRWLIRAFLVRCPVVVACDPDETGAIWGWACTRGQTILYCHVRQDFRRQGLAKLMLDPFLKTDKLVVCAARPLITNPEGYPRSFPLPPGWDYSFLAGLRCLVD